MLKRIFGIYLIVIAVIMFRNAMKSLIFHTRPEPRKGTRSSFNDRIRSPWKPRSKRPKFRTS